ncbi:MAG: hypothetical protein HGB18_01540 [Candidatus Moranbacteria bacterium]|nr:hypothetical protein [Candidatus Moranbacteria bacterium]
MDRPTVTLAICLALSCTAAQPTSQQVLAATVMKTSPAVSIRFYDIERVRPVQLSPMISATASWPMGTERQTAIKTARLRIQEEFRKLPLYAKGYRIESIQADDGFPDFPSQRFYVILQLTGPGIH